MAIWGGPSITKVKSEPTELLEGLDPGEETLSEAARDLISETRRRGRFSDGLPILIKDEIINFNAPLL